MRTRHHSTFALRYSVRSSWYVHPTSPLTSVDSACNSRTEASGCGRSGRVAGAIAVVSPTPSPASRFGPTSYSSVAHRATTRRLATLSTHGQRLIHGRARSPMGHDGPRHTAQGTPEETPASRGSNPRRRTRTAACLVCVHTEIEAQLAVHPFMRYQRQKPPPYAPFGLRPQPPTETTSARACGLHRRETIPDNDTNDADTNTKRNGT